MLVRGEALYLISSPIFLYFGNALPLPCTNSFVLPKNFDFFVPLFLFFFFGGRQWCGDRLTFFCRYEPSTEKQSVEVDGSLSLFVAVQECGALSRRDTSSVSFQCCEVLSVAIVDGSKDGWTVHFLDCSWLIVMLSASRVLFLKLIVCLSSCVMSGFGITP